MERTRLAILLGCLVLVVSAGGISSTAGSAGASPEPVSSSNDPVEPPASAPPSPTDNTTARLTLPNYYVTQSQFETVHIGMGSTLQAGRDRTRFQHRRITIEREFENASTIEEHRSVIDQALIELNDRIKDIEARERAAIRNYSEGTIGKEALVGQLARIDASAREVQQTLVVLDRLARSQGITRFETRSRKIAGRVEPLMGPVRHRVGRTKAGDAPPVRTYIAASNDGVVLSMLSDGQYVRETSYYANRNVNATVGPEFGSMANRVEELYPWVMAHGHPDFHWRERGVWRFRASHPQGELTAFVDAATDDVFREVQWMDVAKMPTTMTVVRTENGLRVTLGRTYEGGPLYVLVEDAATGAVTNAAVTVDGHELGRTGSDGHVQTIEPRVPYTVTVTSDDSSVNVTVDRPFETSEG